MLAKREFNPAIVHPGELERWQHHVPHDQEDALLIFLKVIGSSLQPSGIGWD